MNSLGGEGERICVVLPFSVFSPVLEVLMFFLTMVNKCVV